MEVAGEATGPLVGQYCGQERPPSYVSSSNMLYFNFRSDYSVSHAGFRIRYKAGKGKDRNIDFLSVMNNFSQPVGGSSPLRVASSGLRTTRLTTHSIVSVNTPSALLRVTSSSYSSGRAVRILLNM